MAARRKRKSKRSNTSPRKKTQSARKSRQPAKPRPPKILQSNRRAYRFRAQYKFSVKRFWPFHAGQRVPANPGLATAKEFRRRFDAFVTAIAMPDSALYSVVVTMDISRQAPEGRIKVSAPYWQHSVWSNLVLLPADKYRERVAARLTEHYGVTDEHVYLVRLKTITITGYVKRGQPAPRYRKGHKPPSLYRGKRGHFRKGSARGKDGRFASKSDAAWAKGIGKGRKEAGPVVSKRGRVSK